MKKAKHWILVLALVIFASGTNELWAEKGKKSNPKEPAYIPLPVIKLPSPVKSAKWNRTDRTFAYSENRNIFIRDATTLNVNQQIQASRDIRMLKFAEYGSDIYTDQLLTFSEDNVMAVRVLPNPTPTVAREFLSSTNITAIAFSDDGTYIGLGTDSGQANLYMQLYMTGELSNRMLLGHRALVYSVAFSRDGRFFATASRDGTVRIWETKNANNVAAFTFQTSNEFPVCFTPDGGRLIVVKDKNHLSVRNFDGSEFFEISCEKGIRDIYSATTGNNVIVLNENNEFEYYSLETGAQQGYIPPWNKSQITCYDFSHDDSRLLIGHEDGSIYIVDIDKVYFKSGEKPGIYEMYDVDSGEKWEYDAGKAVVLGEDEEIRRKTAHSIELHGGYRVATSEYYTHGIELGVSYINDRLIQKFYFGLSLNGLCFFSNNDYPYAYVLGGVDILPPCLYGFDLMGFVGKTWHPFKNKEDIELSTDAIFGGGIKFLSSSVLGTGELNTSLAVGLKTALCWNGWSFYVMGSYDTAFIANFGLGISWKHRIAPRVKKAETVKRSIENEATR